ncbi:MAG: hypothetical protein H6830_09085 [Planctomycetes bacterium]|nr:hypothetical protein [Planctomycetota bacterium]MCB9909876.1 hypothetical protein [Planctomycetota bacterium]MCB9913384.1 hypothetical protein [Planctomycetota bacterium]HPF14031.1 hypothetical protein [Planctomycetota bacterium]HRV81199.1 hypothetical protein [Planctomycetota bacterium]
MSSLRSDLLLTSAFLIKGNVEGKYTRLSKLLDEHERQFVSMRDVVLVDLNSRERIQTPQLQVNIREILLAHEFLDEAGDGTRRELAREQTDHLQRVRLFFTGSVNLELAGDIRARAYENSDQATRRFFVMRAPKVRGFKHQDDPHLKKLTELSYAILNKERLSYVYDFNVPA